MSRGLAALALALAAGAVLCASGGEARAAAAAAAKSPCNCTLDSCVLTTGGICCNGFCNCDDSGCGCDLYYPPTGGTVPRCMV